MRRTFLRRPFFLLFQVFFYCLLQTNHCIVLNVQFSTCNCVGLSTNFYGSVVGEINLSSTNIPPAILILSCAIEVEINLAAFEFPPAVFICCMSVEVEVDHSVAYIPPALLVWYDTIEVEVDLSALNIPPAILNCCKSYLIKV